MSWRPAKSLEVLRDQLNEAYPDRNKASDGMRGDAAHAATVSDHNPNAAGVVCAFDITHDPEHGVDIDKLSDELNASRDPRIKYLIANGRILVPNDFGWDNWQPYDGDPHTNHLHVSVWGDYDNETKWNIGEEMEYFTREELAWSYYAITHKKASDKELDNYLKSGKSYKKIEEEIKRFNSDSGRYKEIEDALKFYEDNKNKLSTDPKSKAFDQIKSLVNGVK